MKKKIIFIFLLFMAIFMSYIYFEVNYTKINKVFIKSNKIPTKKSIKILQISDLHNKKFPNNNKHLLNKIKKLDADIIVITGDVIDYKTMDFKNVYTFLENIVEINPNTYFVTGNHEWRNLNTKEFIKGLEKINLINLNNSNTIFSKEDIIINVCGIDDPYSNKEDINKSFNNINVNYFTILLSHSPNVLIKYKDLPVNLILSGHTHGGQIRFPFIGGIIAPGQGFFPKYDKGIYKISDNTILYIDSGLGTSRFPIRFLNRSQMSLITISN